MINNKKGPIVFDIIAGFILMVGGLLVAFGMVNLGSLIATLGLMMELIKLIIEKGF